MTEHTFIITPEYRAAHEAFNAALKSELEVSKVFGADRSEANWAKCLEAHDTAQRAKMQMDALEPEWLKSND